MKNTQSTLNTAGESASQVNNMSASGRVFSKSEQQDIQAVHDILAGQTQKFEVIYKHYYPIILQNYTLNLKFDKDLAEDLTADLFIKVFQSLNKYKIQYTFNSWITRVAKNFLIDYTRKLKLETVSMDAGASSEKMKNESSDSIKIDVCDEGENPEEVIMSAEKRSCLEAAMNKLDGNSREAINKYFFEEKSYIEIAEDMDMPLGTLKNIIFRAKLKLKNILEMDKKALAVVLD
jgi:RNA polymerase sigma-70 factor (ECF subfamily)